MTVSHIVIGIVGVLLFTVNPTDLHAGVITSFTDKVKAIFLAKNTEVEDSQILATAQTMTLFKPTVVDGTTTESAEEFVDTNQESLQAVSGALRVSTEDIDFPVTDTVSVYEVKKGDTLQDVAALFNVSVNTIIWANNLSSKTITKGDTLIILPVTGIKHVVKKGDSISSVAKKYKADAQDIAIYNGLSVDSSLTLGDTVIVPDGEIEIASQPKTKTSPKTKSRILNSYTYSAPSGFLARPVVGGRKTQGIHGHNGIDIAATPGTPVLAAASGRAIVAKIGGYNGGYGNMIIITHEKGVQTVYAHLQNVYITQGQTVTQGQTIGEVGNTGRSTGPHLHFEVRGAKNPF
jgi:murein DD-endopeptidase MepM/ murein hydrolase activator NlpD